MHEILTVVKKRMHGAEFILEKRRTMTGEKYFLNRVVAGEVHPMKEVRSMKEGTEYIHKHYRRDHAKFTRLMKRLSEDVRRNLHLFDFDPEKETQEVCRNLMINTAGFSYHFRVSMQLTCIFNRIESARITKIEAMNNGEVRRLLDMFEKETLAMLSNDVAELVAA